MTGPVLETGLAEPPADDAGGERWIGHCYTKARRMPIVVGRMPGGGGQLIGGPYTMAQLGVMVGLFVPMVMTRSLWGTHSLADLLIVLVVPVGASWALRFARTDGRNPVSALLSLIMLLSGPRHGRLRGRPWRSRPASRTAALCTLGAAPAEDDLAAGVRPGDAVTDLVDDAAEDQDAGRPRPLPGRAAPVPGPAPSTTPEPEPAPAPVSVPAAGPVSQPAASGVQALLARHRAAATPTEP